MPNKRLKLFIRHSGCFAFREFVYFCASLLWGIFDYLATGVVDRNFLDIANRHILNLKAPIQLVVNPSKPAPKVVMIHITFCEEGIYLHDKIEIY